jgi:SRSO17 transposase
VPETIAFQTKPEIAFEQIEAARAAGLPEGVVLMDAGYGNDTGLRTDITALGLRYVAGIGPNTSVWPPGEAPMPPQSRTGRGRPQTRLQRRQHQPISVKTLALGLPQEGWQTITWREGTTDRLSSRFARWRVRPAHRDNLLSELRAEEGLLIEWPEDETEPTKYWFSEVDPERATAGAMS